MSVISRLANLDRRVIYLFVAVAIIVPLQWPMGLPLTVSKQVRDFHASIERIPDGSTVLLAMDYDPTALPELYPMNIAVLKHLFSKRADGGDRNMKIVGLSLFPAGPPLELVGAIGVQTVVANGRKNRCPANHEKESMGIPTKTHETQDAVNNRADRHINYFGLGRTGCRSNRAESCREIDDRYFCASKTPSQGSHEIKTNGPDCQSITSRCSQMLRLRWIPGTNTNVIFEQRSRFHKS